MTKTLAAVLLSGVLATSAFAQDTPPAKPAQGGDAPAAGDRGNRRGNFDPGQWRQQQQDRLKDQLGMSDDEFKAVQPKIEKIQELQRDQTVGRFMGMASMMSRRGGGAAAGGNPAAGDRPGAGDRPAGGDRPGFGQAMNSPVAQKARDLQQSLDNKDAKPAEIKAKLEALRAERAKAHEEMTKAQAELRELLTQRQEAVLVTQGVLE